MPTPLMHTTAAPVRAQLAGFTTEPALPVLARSWALTGAERRQVVDGYHCRGYALVEVPGPATSGDLTALAGALRLGPAFTPPLYTGSTHTAGGVSRLTAADNSEHPFQHRGGQRVHCDGTLQELGQITTTVMMCVAPAAKGGQSFLVNLVDAYTELRRMDPQAALQLAHPEALTRTSTWVPHHQVTGPAFAEQRPGTWITRFSRTVTDSYQALPGGDAALERALAILNEATLPGSPHRTDFTLTAGQALVLANDRLGHGRSPYRGDPSAPLLLLRSLFTARPRP